MTSCSRRLLLSTRSNTRCTDFKEFVWTKDMYACMVEQDVYANIHLFQKLGIVLPTPRYLNA